MNKPRTIDVLVRNLTILMQDRGWNSRKLGELTGISSRHIDYVLKGEKSVTVEKADDLARPFGLTGWQLLMPNLPEDLLKSGKINTLITAYVLATNEGRAHINHVAEREAEYSKKKI